MTSEGDGYIDYFCSLEVDPKYWIIVRISERTLKRLYTVYQVVGSGVLGHISDYYFAEYMQNIINDYE